MSAIKYFSLSWDSFQTGICKGFAEQQNRQEFVDMTLVAEGHLVKVHKNLICLASSFIKHLIKSVPCEHPIIFLNNVSHETLSYLLEYIYTGEVKVAEDKLQTVLRAANELKLYGLEQLSQKKPTPQVPPICGKSAIVSPTVGVPTHDVPVHRVVNALVSNENTYQYTNEYEPEHMSVDCNNHSSVLDTNSGIFVPEHDIHFDDDTGATAAPQPDSAETITTIQPHGTHQVTNITIDATGSLLQQYSVSARGCPQLVLGRFVYNLHHSACGGRRRRWRCAHYRRARCAAYVDTLGHSITARKNVHHHESHDDIILKKVRDNRVFGSLTATTIAASRESSGESSGAANACPDGRGSAREASGDDELL